MYTFLVRYLQCLQYFLKKIYIIIRSIQYHVLIVEIPLIQKHGFVACIQYESRQRGIITFLVFIVEEEEKEEEDIPDIPLHHIDAKEAQKEDNGRG